MHILSDKQDKAKKNHHERFIIRTKCNICDLSEPIWKSTVAWSYKSIYSNKIRIIFFEFLSHNKNLNKVSYRF